MNLMINRNIKMITTALAAVLALSLSAIPNQA